MSGISRPNSLSTASTSRVRLLVKKEEETDSFMNDLFADLDASVFASSPPSSSCKTPSSSFKQKQASASKVVIKRDPEVGIKDEPNYSPNAPKVLKPLQDGEFWNDPRSRPLAVGSDRSGTISLGIDLKKQTRPVKRKSDEGIVSFSQDVKRKIKHVDIEILPKKDKGKGKENEGISNLEIKKSPKKSPKKILGSSNQVKVEEENMQLFDGIDFDDDEMDEIDGPVEQSTPRGKDYVRCVIKDVEHVLEGRRRTIIHITSDRFEGSRQAVLMDDWIQTPIEKDYIVNLVGNFDAHSTPSITIDRSSGYLIVHPDILVSSTKVADSAQCSRKALLQEIIRSSNGTTPSLVYGNMLHSLMQACTLDERWDDDYRREKIQEIVQAELQTLWSIEKPGPIEAERAREDMWEKSKEFENFSQVYLGDRPGIGAELPDAHANKGDTTARLAITKGLAIEEDIWSPRFGLKGKIDVSVAAKVAEGPFTSPGTFPFEIKTGKSSAGMEHRAQTMLYTLLMSDRYDETIDSGLLYYTQSNQVLRVKAARNELRGLLLARNEFASYLHRRLSLSTNNSWLLQSTQVKAEEEPSESKPLELDPPSALPMSSQMSESEAAFWADDPVTPPREPLLQDIENPLLPEPIDDARSCKWCYVRDACMLYRKAIDGDVEVSNDDDKGTLQQLYDDQTSHLTENQLEFFRKWERLITLEEQEQIKYKKEIWTLGALEREKLGRCLANMSIDTTFEVPPALGGASRVHSFTYRLKRATQLATKSTTSQKAADSLLGGAISVNDPIVITLENPSVLAISRGFVHEMSATHIVVGVDHSLTDSPQITRSSFQEPSQLIYRVDKDELAAGMGRIRDNVLQLFVPKGDDRRRELVVDLAEPQFDEPYIEGGGTKQFIAPDLNEDQTGAIDRVLRARDYALVLGMPGTGKTTTIAELLKALTKQGKSVLLTSYTHSAVDNILLKVQNTGLNILRLGNRDKIMPELHHLTPDLRDPATTLAQLDNRFMMPQVVATTCLGINDPIFSKRRFDVCIVDEASQVTLPTCLGPLRFADRFVLVGDHNQLPPLVRNPAARTGGLDESLFARLSQAHPSAIVHLTIQYRMNQEIMLLSNELVYGGELRVGSEFVAKRRLALSGWKDVPEGWKGEVTDPDRPVLFVDTDRMPALERKRGPLIDNVVEADLVTEICDTLINSGLPSSELGLIAPYRQQIKLLSQKLSCAYPDLEILTADRSQGRDKLCIVMSLVRSNPEGNVGDLLTDWRRLNVCLTRAKAKLIVVGSRKTLKRVDVLNRFLDIVEREDRRWIYELPRNALGKTEAKVEV